MQLLISVLNWDKYCYNANLYELLFTDEISTFLSFACWEARSLFLSMRLHESWRLGKRKIQVNVDSCLPRVKNKQNVSFSASVVNAENEWFLNVEGWCQRYMIHFTKQSSNAPNANLFTVTQNVSCLCLYVHDKESNWVVCVAALFTIHQLQNWSIKFHPVTFHKSARFTLQLCELIFIRMKK